MMSPKLILKAGVMVMVSAMMMGNEGCGEEPVDMGSSRPRRIVEIGKIAARPVQLPNGQLFDLEFVINQQFPDVLVSSQQYKVINRDLFNYKPAGSFSLQDMALISKMGAPNEKIHYSKEAACLLDLPQFKLNGAVNSYEWVSGGGLSIGYTPSGDHSVTGIGGKVDFEKAEMDLSIRALSSVGNKLIESANITKDQLKTKVGFSISFGLISIGPEFYHQKGLAQVSREAIEKALASLRKATDKYEWYTRVMANHENFVTIIGGNDIDLKLGDTVSIHNSLYYWDDNRVCDPDAFRGSLHGDPIAYGEIVELGEEVSRVKLDQSTIIEAPLDGAVVKILKLVDEPATQK